MALTGYYKKREFRNTPEPRGAKKRSAGELIFVVQQHAASHLHYDFRLEMEGVLKSWAVPKGPSMNPGDKRLAMMVEDHPYDYKDFEGTIPAGNYGAGNVIVWDNGTYHAAGGAEDDEKALLAGLKKGHISFVLEGKKLKGEFALIRMHGRGENAWLLVKKEDKYASEKDVLKKDRSVKTNRRLEELERAAPRGVVKRKVEKKDRPKSRPQKTEPVAPKSKKKELEHLKPMLAEIGSGPFDREGWVFELKYDGYRALANISGGNVELYSRNDISFNDSYPEIAEELSKIQHTAILDGEIVVEDEQGRTGFQLLQNRGGDKSGVLKYYVFDLLHLNGYDLTQLPLVNRKELLKSLLSQVRLKNIHYSPHVQHFGVKFYKEATGKKAEGIMAKDGKSPYRLARRSKEWQKIRIHQEQEAVIVGFTEPRGSRKHFGSLLLAFHEGDEWVYAGNCGTGFNERMLKALYEKAKPYFTSQSPLRERVRTSTPVQWLEPHLVCQVKFSEWTGDGRMRHPVFLGLREDKSAEEVVRELPPGTNGKQRVKARSVKPKATAKSKKAAVKKETAEKKNAAEKKSTAEKKNPAGKKNAGEKKAKKAAGYELKLGKVTLQMTNPDKIYWPKEGYRKGDLVAYYDRIAPLILPYLEDRPQSMHRFPNGIDGGSFFQKDVDTDKSPSWLHTEKIYSESNKEYIDYLICNDKATLLYMANLGCIEINPWNSRLGAIDKPDWVVIDLDPEEIAFKEVVRAALGVRELMDELEMECYCKTSGASGLHVYIPLGAKYTYDETKSFAELIANLVHKRMPATTSVVRSPAKRKKKVYLDFLQNRRGQTLAAPYSVRPKPGATVATPLRWEEVNDKLDPSRFTMQTIFSRIEKLGDIWKPALGKGADILKALKKMQELELTV